MAELIAPARYLRQHVPPYCAASLSHRVVYYRQRSAASRAGTRSHHRVALGGAARGGRPRAYQKTEESVAFLKRINLWTYIEKVYNLKRHRAGKGKSRNRRYKQKKGPLVIYNNDGGLVKAFRDISGVITLSVNRLNLLKLAPGGTSAAW